MSEETEKVDVEESIADKRGGRRILVEIAGATLVVLLLVLGFAAYRAGSVVRALPYLMGQRFFVPETEIILGEVPVGTDVERSIRLINGSSEPASILGARKSCGCISLDSFPFQVPPHDERQLQLKLQVPSEPIDFVHTVELYVDDQQFSSFQIVLSGTTIEK